ncbi:hypothetical protein EYC80_003203 [Monilinia laxa]|uniref:Uncharacterized protein n=1 Tax=Monilinia laxa TaxID=61186 RepID=A0A5N6KEA3_MONLA|nr:hypothetical protein EYC80_003203 [Monilinia laxa]
MEPLIEKPKVKGTSGLDYFDIDYKGRWNKFNATPTSRNLHTMLQAVANFSSPSLNSRSLFPIPQSWKHIFHPFLPKLPNAAPKLLNASSLFSSVVFLWGFAPDRSFSLASVVVLPGI